VQYKELERKNLEEMFRHAPNFSTTSHSIFNNLTVLIRGKKVKVIPVTGREGP
jgi:hypothetical protein